MDEFALIQNYFARAQVGADVRTGIGDDCAVVSLPPGRDLVVSIDTMVSGVHFPAEAEPEKIGVRVLSAALSDLAAMGARAHWFTLALTLPEADADWLAAFSDGLFSVANQHECSLIGGDTTRGPLCISVQVHGSVPAGNALRRSGAHPGDIIFVTGNLGDGAAALAVLKKDMTVRTKAFEYLLKRFYAPTPRLREGEMLLGTASACIDISDGLYADLSKICEASGVGAALDLGRLPGSALWKEYTHEDQRYRWMLAGGDDYELCFTVPKAHLPQLDQWIRDHKLVATPIGKITNKQGMHLVKNGQPYVLDQRGFNHFV